jgi:hypothetical protein
LLDEFADRRKRRIARQPDRFDAAHVAPRHDYQVRLHACLEQTADEARPLLEDRRHEALLARDDDERRRDVLAEEAGGVRGEPVLRGAVRGDVLRVARERFAELLRGEAAQRGVLWMKRTVAFGVAGGQ